LIGPLRVYFTLKKVFGYFAVLLYRGFSFPFSFVVGVFRGSVLDFMFLVIAVLRLYLPNSLPISMYTGHQYISLRLALFVPV
jgi:hypothetical protein